MSRVILSFYLLALEEFTISLDTLFTLTKKLSIFQHGSENENFDPMYVWYRFA